MTDEQAMTIRVVDSLAGLAAERWDALARSAPLYHSYSWLRWAEVHHGLPTWYVLAEDGNGRLLGAVLANLLRRVPGGTHRWYDPVRTFLAPHCGTKGTVRHWFPVLVLGGCSGYHSAVLRSSDLDDAMVAAMVRRLIERCHAIAEEQGCGSVAFMYAPRPACAEVAGAWPGATRTVPTSALATLRLATSIGAFDDYVAHLPRPRRRKVRKEIADFTDAGGRVSEYRLGEVCDRVAPLLGAHQRKYGDWMTDEEAGRYLARQEQYLGGLSTVFADEQNGTIRAFVLCYAHHDTIYVRAGGIDRGGAAPYAYFNLAVYAPIRLAIESGLTSVALGMGSFEAKRLRGAQLTPLGSVVVTPAHLEPDWAAALDRAAPQAIDAGVA